MTNYIMAGRLNVRINTMGMRFFTFRFDLQGSTGETVA